MDEIDAGEQIDEIVAALNFQNPPPQHDDDHDNETQHEDDPDQASLTSSTGRHGTSRLSLNNTTPEASSSAAAPRRSLFSPRSSRSASAVLDSSPTPLSRNAHTPSPTVGAMNMNPLSGGSSTPRRGPRMSGEMSLLESGVLAQAEKDGDDPSSTTGTTEAVVYTPTAFSRLLGGQVRTTSPSVSREASYSLGNESLLRRSTNSETSSLPDHLYTQGLLAGRHSDIAVIAFGHKYHLHRLILDRAPFFSSAFSEPWLESRAKEVTLHPEETDSNITRNAFELALKKLYGCDISTEEDSEAVGLFATGCWLDMQDLVDSAIDSILRQISPETLPSIIQLVTNSFYGKPGDRILASSKAMLCRDGWEMPLKNWDGIPGEIVQELVGGDGFYVSGEWDRWNLARKIYDRRLKQRAAEIGLIHSVSKSKPIVPPALVRFLPRFNSNSNVGASRSSTSSVADSEIQRWFNVYVDSDIEPIASLLDSGIHYLHLEFEQIQHIRQAKDVFGLPLVPDLVILNALYMQMELRQKVVNARDTDLELGLSQVDVEPTQQPSKNMDSVERSKGKGRVQDDASSLLTLSDESSEPPQKPRYWIPSADCNIVMGANSEPIVTTGPISTALRVNQNAPSDAQWAADLQPPSPPLSVTNRPGTPLPNLNTPQNTSVSSPNQPCTNNASGDSFSHFPPFRFAAEFPAPRRLKEKKRVYSRTVFYAGSLWNIYIQKMRAAKSLQLGVYLHRAKERDDDTTAANMGPAATVDERIGLLESMLLRSDQRRTTTGRPRMRAPRASVATPASGTAVGRHSIDAAGSRVQDISAPLFPNRSRRRNTIDPFGDVTMQSYISLDTDSSDSDETPDWARSDGPHSLPAGLGQRQQGQQQPDRSSTSSPETALATAQLPQLPLVPALPPYTDVRKTIRTYFKIYSPSKAGRLLSVYESKPDMFDFSQSWGWRSSTLMLDEGLIDDGVLGDDGDIIRGRNGMLRFMVVIGNL